MASRTDLAMVVVVATAAGARVDVRLAMSDGCWRLLVAHVRGWKAAEAMR